MTRRPTDHQRDGRTLHCRANVQRLPDRYGPPENPNGFERYAGRQKRFTGVPTINIRVGQVPILYLSSAFMAQYGSDLRYAQLAYDRQHHSLALLLGTERPGPEVAGFLITPDRRTGSGMISSLGFFRRFDLDPEQYVGRYLPREVSARELGFVHNGIAVVIDLQQPRSGGTRPGQRPSTVRS